MLGERTHVVAGPPVDPTLNANPVMKLLEILLSHHDRGFCLPEVIMIAPLLAAASALTQLLPTQLEWVASGVDDHTVIDWPGSDANRPCHQNETPRNSTRPRRYVQMIWSTSIVLAVLAFTAACPAQAEPPAREGNIWGGIDHEPNPAAVHQDEKAAGLLSSPQEQQRLNDEVERTARKLLDDQPASLSNQTTPLNRGP
jgi:hypothetical protein